MGVDAICRCDFFGKNKVRCDFDYDAIAITAFKGEVGEFQIYFRKILLHRAGAKGGPGSQPPHFRGLAPLLLTNHITNIQLNYYFFNQYFMFSTKKYA